MAASGLSGPTPSTPSPGNIKAESDVLQRFRKTKGDADAKSRYLAVTVLTEVISEQRQQHGLNTSAPPTPTEYFGGCIVVLESVAKQKQVTDQHVSFLFLLTVVLPSVPGGILRKKSEECLRILASVLQAAQRLRNPLLLNRIDKYCIASVGICLNSVDHANGAWMRRPILSAYEILLKALPDSRPKVRKTAQQAVLNILCQRCKDRTPHKLFSKVCISVLSSCSVTDCTSTMQLLSFLNQALPVLKSGSDKKVIVKEIVRLTGLHHNDLARCALVTLNAYFSTSTTTHGKVRHDKKVMIEVLKAISALSGSHTRLLTRDATVCKAWTGTVENAYTRLYEEDKSEALLQLSTVTSSMVTTLCAAEKLDVAASPVMGLCRLIFDTVDGSFAATKVLEACDKLILPQYQRLWSQSFSIYSKLFEKLKTESDPCMIAILRKLILIRESVINPITGADKENIRVPWRGAIEGVVKSAIKAIGVESFLQHISLQGEGQKAVERGVAPSRVWLLPILRSALPGTSTTLEYFRVGILKVAAECEELSKNAALGPATCKVHATRAMQLWSLFPAFCQNSSDVSKAAGFSAIAPVLAQDLETSSEYPELADTVCEGMQILIDSNQENEKEAEAIASFSEIFLPLLFNSYIQLTKEKKPDRARRIQRLVASYSKLAQLKKPKLLNELFRQLLREMLTGKGNSEAPESMEVRALASLSLALIPCLEDEKSITLLYRVIRPYIEDDSDQLLQKSGYKVLEAICEHQPSWVLDRREELIGLMRSSLLATSASAKTSRLRCLKDIVKSSSSNLGPEQFTELVAELIGEVMLCTKESNNKARMAAFKLLITLAECIEDVYVKNGKGSGLGTLLEILVAGLAAQTPHMRSAVVVSMCRVFTEYGKVAEIQEQLKQVARTTLLLSAEKSREVAKSVISFAKVCSVRLPPETTNDLLDDIITSLLPWANDSKNRFSLKIRIIFERLMKKHSEAVLASSAIPSDHKVLTYINKQAAYKKRRHEKKIGAGVADISDEEMDGDSDENDSEDSEAAAQNRKGNLSGKRKRAQNAEISDQIVMDERDGEVDLLDTSALGKVSISRRTGEGMEDSDDDSLIEFTADGKIKLHEDASDSEDDMDDFMDSDDDFDGTIKKRIMKSKSDKIKSASANSKRRKVNTDEAPTFKAKRAAGDVRRKGVKVEPYSYIKLDPKLLNKRRKHEAKRQFKGIGKSRLRREDKGRESKGGRARTSKRR